jgi:hypothetical protein
VAAFGPEGDALLYSIDVKHLLTQYGKQKGQDVAFQWTLRPCAAHGHVAGPPAGAEDGRSGGSGSPAKKDGRAAAAAADAVAAAAPALVAAAGAGGGDASQGYLGTLSWEVRVAVPRGVYSPTPLPHSHPLPPSF